MCACLPAFNSVRGLEYVCVCMCVCLRERVCVYTCIQALKVSSKPSNISHITYNTHIKIHTHTNIHTHIRTRVLTDVSVHILHGRTRACTHAQCRIHSAAYIPWQGRRRSFGRTHTHAQTYTHTHTHTFTLSLSHTHKHTHTHTRTHTHIPTCTRACTHTHTCTHRGDM